MRRGWQWHRKGTARLAVVAGAISLVVVGCTSDSDRAEPAASTAAPAPAATTAETGGAAPAKETELELGELTFETTPIGVSASAEEAERCGSSQWRLTGPVTFEQASPVPDQCFGGAHAFNTTWYGLSLPPGDYELSLTIRRGLAVGTTSAAFEITGP